MKSILTWSLDKILYLTVILVMLFEEGLDSFEKSLLILIVVVLMYLDKINETIKNSNK